MTLTHDLDGRTAVVTGGYSGLGLATTRALVDAGATVVVPARRPGAAERALVGVPRTRVVGCDLADLTDVRRCADEIAATVTGIDLLVAAAGVMASPRRTVGPGWDFQLAVNHLGHGALTMRLFPLLAERGARVIVYSSAGHHLSDIRWDDPHFLTGYDRWLAYGQSKTANVLFAVHLDRLAQANGVRAFALHPGKIITGLQRDLTREEQVDLGWLDADGNVVGSGFLTPEQGAATGLWAATSPDLDDRGGLYLEEGRVATLAVPGGSMDDGGVQPYAVDAVAAERWWQTTCAMTATRLEI